MRSEGTFFKPRSITPNGNRPQLRLSFIRAGGTPAETEAQSPQARYVQEQAGCQVQGAACGIIHNSSFYNELRNYWRSCKNLKNANMPCLAGRYPHGVSISFVKTAGLRIEPIRINTCCGERKNPDHDAGEWECTCSWSQVSGGTLGSEGDDFIRETSRSER